jgi:alkylation response protein AidB-like acyl-CoA dehydrogenase
MALTAQQRDQQYQQAEELFFKEGAVGGFAKGLFFGLFNSDIVFPYPQLAEDERGLVSQKQADLKSFMEKQVDSTAIDRNCEIPTSIVHGLGDIGILGASVPKSMNGIGLSQYGYCKLLEVVGAYDASVAIFVNAHHSIGIRGLILEGTDEQKAHWLPRLAKGREIGAFALTEPEAGSDAGNVQTTADPTPDGSAFILNGYKHYITNGGFAKMLTLMARTPKLDGSGTEITAFMVTPDMPGFEIVEKNPLKCGVRGSQQAKLRFTNMRVPKENIFGKRGRGLKLALSILNFGRTTFGATCAGAARTCIAAAARHANTRKQFDQTLGDFEMVKKKLAHMAADAFAMESATYVCAGLIDRGGSDYMLETAMLKVWASDALWQIVNDCIQIYGGKAYFSDEPYERMMRDARINMIGEGANDVLRQFIAMYGLGTVGKVVDNALKSPFTGMGALFRFAGGRLAARFKNPEVPVNHKELQPHAKELAQRVRDFGHAVEGALLKHSKKVLDKEYVQERLADAAIELFNSAAVLSRLDYSLSHPSAETPRDLQVGGFYLTSANRRIKQKLVEMGDNDDDATTSTANVILDQYRQSLVNGKQG